MTALDPMLTDPALADLPLTVYAEPPADGWYAETYLA